MPGLAGLISMTAPANLAAVCAAMAGRMKLYPWYQQQNYADEAGGIALARVTLGFINKAPQPAYNEKRTWLAMMDGELYDYELHRKTLESLGHEFCGTSHAELLLHGFEQSGLKFFEGLEGTFAAAIWESDARRLHLVNDRWGMKPFYYVHLPGKLLFASEIKALLEDPAVSRKIDPRGLAQFFTFGQLLAEDTLYEGLRLLPAAASLTYDAGKDEISLERYWRLQSHAGSNGVTSSQILDRLDESFKRAVDRRVGGTENLGISLSGGLDSRTILANIDSNRALTSVCLGMEGSIDHDSALEMARLTGRPHHRYILNTEFLTHFEEHMRHMVHLTDGHYLSQCIVIPTLPLYRELGIEVLLRGHAGELMHMEKAYNFSLNKEALAFTSAAELEGWLFGRLRTYMLDAVDGSLFAPAFQDSIDELARDSFQGCFRESDGMQPLIHRVWHMFISQRLRRETAMSMMEFGSVVETRLPFLDNELVDALLAAPPGMKLSDTIQRHILTRRLPAFLNVVNANTGARLGANRLERFLAKVRLKVFAKLGVKGYQPYERLGLWLRQDLRSVVERVLLSSRCLDRGIFNPDTVRSVVRQHFDNQRNHTFLLMAMMIFEAGQEEFVDGMGIKEVTRGPMKSPLPTISP
ncbi:MAG: asparagine synthetase B family protein [Gemmataceae bacterium]